MAKHDKAALDFLGEFTEYLRWRAHRRQPADFDVKRHADAFKAYLRSCGLTPRSTTFKALAKYMDGFNEAGGVPRQRPLKS
jgi:hypothetical protein